MIKEARDMNGNRQLLIRPEPTEGESWPAYLVYLAAVNEFDSLAPIAAAAGVTERQLTNGDPSETLRRLGIASSLEVSDGSGRWRGSGVWVSHEPEWLTRVCTECIRKGRARVPSVWALPMEMACVDHRCELLGECPRCRLRIDLARFDWRTCDCGLNFADVAAVEAPPWMLRVSWILRHELKHARQFATFAASTDRELEMAKGLLKLSALAGTKGHREFFSKFGEPELEEATRRALQDRRDWRRCIAECGMELSPTLARFLFRAAGLSQSHLRCAELRARQLCKRFLEPPTVGRLWRYAVRHILYECSCPPSLGPDMICGWVDVDPPVDPPVRTVNAGLR